jgi:hypothetical protein
MLKKIQKSILRPIAMIAGLMAMTGFGAKAQQVSQQTSTDTVKHTHYKKAVSGHQEYDITKSTFLPGTTPAVATAPKPAIVTTTPVVKKTVHHWSQAQLDLFAKQAADRKAAEAKKTPEQKIADANKRAAVAKHKEDEAIAKALQQEAAVKAARATSDSLQRINDALKAKKPDILLREITHVVRDSSQNVESDTLQTVHTIGKVDTGKAATTPAPIIEEKQNRLWTIGGFGMFRDALNSKNIDAGGLQYAAGIEIRPPGFAANLFHAVMRAGAIVKRPEYNVLGNDNNGNPVFTENNKDSRPNPFADALLEFGPEISIGQGRMLVHPYILGGAAYQKPDQITASNLDGTQAVLAAGQTDAQRAFFLKYGGGLDIAINFGSVNKDTHQSRLQFFMQANLTKDARPATNATMQNAQATSVAAVSPYGYVAQNAGVDLDVRAGFRISIGHLAHQKKEMAARGMVLNGNSMTATEARLYAQNPANKARSVVFQ